MGFIILTDITELSIEFCVDEVNKDQGGLDMRRRRRGKSSSLGMPKVLGNALISKKFLRTGKTYHGDA